VLDTDPQGRTRIHRITYEMCALQVLRDQLRLRYLSPEVILGHARGRVVEPMRLRRVFRLRQLTRLVCQHGQIRLHHFGLSIDQ
jgi:hypothetical protein